MVKKIGERNTWFAEDAAHNENRYEQIITIDPQNEQYPTTTFFCSTYTTSVHYCGL